MWDLTVSVPDHCLSFYFVTSVIEHCLTAFFDVSNHQHSSISVTTFSKLMNEQLSQRLFKLKYIISKYMYMYASCSHDVLSNPHTCIRRMTSQIGYLKLLITRIILSGPLDFEIKTAACKW